MQARTLWTAESVEQLPEDERFEILRGEALPVSPTGFTHLFVTGALVEFVRAFVRTNGLGVAGGEGGFVLQRDPDTVLAPDLAFVREDRLPPDGEWEGFQHLAPDLVAEVVSPRDTVGEVTDKTLTYLDAGVRLVWVVDPRRRIVTVYTPDGLARVLRAGDTLDGGDVLPGFAIPVADLFPVRK